MKNHFALPAAATMAALITVTTAACGGISEQQAAGPAQSGSCTTSSVLEQVKDMPAEQRTAKLQELAKDEPKSITMYGDLGLDELQGVLDTFKAKYGVSVETYSASSEEVLQRLGSENQAKHVQGDLFQNNGTELTTASTEGLLAPVTTPYAEGLPPEVITPDWVGTQYNVFTVLRNDTVIDEKDAPRTYLDLADPKYDGKIGIEAGNFDLFATIVQYLEKNNGMTEDQAVDVWRKIADGAVVYTSNTPLADAVNQGELGLAVTYNHYYSRLKERGGTHLQWQPPITPQVLRPNGVAIPCQAPNPDTAVLFFDFFVSKDGQQALADKVNRDVTNPAIKSGLLPETSVERAYVNLDELMKNSEHWKDLYDEITRNAQAG